MAEKLYIVGLGGHARVVVALARSAGFEPAGFIDMQADQPGAQAHEAGFEISGVRIAGGLSALGHASAPNVAIAVGDNAARVRIASEIRAAVPGARFPALIHGTAKIERDARIAEGAQICIGAIVCAQASIGAFAIINSGAIIDHEDVIEEGAHVSPGARLAGRVRVGRCTHIGIGATIIERVTIGADSIVGGGSVVLTDVPANTTAVGVPVRHLPRKGPAAH
ncbi:MAG: NeuD/PglB/VioB family sugar acetyltransferase [Planctomycetes bacterium]|nr:NeuD/PglB/VioB family sugar acetyltransferase [Planctomycetota bacterium]